ncbi:MAG TPA: hypothetical protein EYO96_05335 [Candidatus Marinimicrobia bacterium]|jgi:hypothetical protein|nr:hypothetical protein [Candidatus Neomarinimicrobiota bacterium]
MADPTTFAYVVLKAIQDRIMLTQAAILQGRPKDFMDYCDLTGELRGLEFAEQEVKDALQSSEEE